MLLVALYRWLSNKQRAVKARRGILVWRPACLHHFSAVVPTTCLPLWPQPPAIVFLTFPTSLTTRPTSCAPCVPQPTCLFSNVSPEEVSCTAAVSFQITTIPYIPLVVVRQTMAATGVLPIRWA